MLDGEIGLIPRETGRHAHLLKPRLPTLPAETLDEGRCRCDDVRRAVEEIAPSVAIEVHGVLEIVRGEKLGLPEFARPRSDHVGGLQVAAVDDLQRRQQFAAKHLATPAIVGECCE